ncbi:23S rRNA (uracil(1939)-C(5))-methyltransferase RlmD [Candidatus Endoriftia persephonae]|jgi:23S rRNA (uracil1939-C5)-methyltransferase|uniref:23S rRNA (uracil(1939)-C(5))-methyltransferase RlmD n=2 Tax=Gammaproteobacteria TaxID=1236 RepID=G2FE99_9GAMM|nr:23S rRNA (uracil(1939)-C(5))-methyltransferase RlmD [Candidatus Endoriftia persephone]EGW54869.1 23S rRNA (uracil-5-)-methyltransferase RumA [endosymbiont of Tevnia jerichonana (vent Tica)]USF89158.1 23S rRNA (uracil(1939)-C(5))-methyltransferase RlmD [Candidatus Endoriftia persephone]
MGRSRRRKKLPAEPVEANIESMSHDGKGVVHIEGKATFLVGGLPGERVRFLYTQQRRKYDEGRVVEVLQASPERVEPRCTQFGICGGCSLQHQAPAAQIQTKQQALLDALEHLGKVEPETVLEPLLNETPWGYRRKARLGVRDVPKKGKVLVGFRERGSSFIADIEQCHILHPRVGQLLPQLSQLIEGLSVKRQVPQIEMAMGDETLVLIFRILESLNEADRQALAQFGAEHQIEIYIQEGGLDTIQPLSGIPADLNYRLPDFDLSLDFLPIDFTQVNTGINRQMVSRVVEMLDPGANERVLDLFCGLGNFTLPLARRAGEVVGVEGDAGLVTRGRANAERNGIDNVDYFTANLYEPLEQEPWLLQRFDKALLDPPRSGAQEVLEHLPKLGVERIVYVSCYPGTLARDAGILCHQHGYRLVSAGVMDMFPHTAHVESIALFEKG